MTAQVGSQVKPWDKPGTFTKARIIYGFDTEPTNRIFLPEIPHPFWRLFRDSEAIKRQPVNIIRVSTHIRD